VKLSDIAAGLLVCLLGGAVVLMARTFPPMPGQNIGPALFPTIVGVGLVVLGLVLLASGRRRQAPFISIDDDMRRPRMALNFGVVIIALLAYAFIVDRLGFFLTAALLLALLFRAFGVAPRRTAVLAAVLPFFIHYIFYSLLRVPLPWGVFENLAW
jgi:putative tricarboxylic transport membrane protein